MSFFDENMNLAVKRGAYMLDERMPRWAELIRLEDLEMDDCASCIVGQAVGSYATGIAKLSGISEYSREAFDWAIDHGFDLSEDYFEKEGGVAGYNAYRQLETLWGEEVRKRLG
jgi:hypothetical protein